METEAKRFDRVEKLFQIDRVVVKGTSSMSVQHYHNAYELFYLVQGERNYFIKNRIYLIEKGSLVFVNMNELHRTSSAKPGYERVLINFKHDFIGGLSSDLGLDLLACFSHSFNAIKLNASQQVFVEGLLNRMLSEDRKKSYGYEISIKIMLLELLLMIARFIKQEPEDLFDNQNPLHKKVSGIINYINANFADPLTLKSLSGTFFMSPCYLSRVFKEVTGFNFTEYLNNVRILESRKLLKESGRSITEIAGRVGYESATHYGRVFKAITGMSPIRFRKTSL